MRKNARYKISQDFAIIFIVSGQLKYIFPNTYAISLIIY